MYSVVRPLERLAVSGSFALGVYLALSTSDPVYIGALFAFIMLSQRVSAPLDANGANWSIKWTKRGSQ